MQCGTCESFSPIDVTLNWTPAIHASVYKVGFLSAAYMPIGGTETFHRSLVPRLKDVVNIAGFVTTAIFGGDGSKLEVPYATNILSAQKLASHCQTIVAWGIDSLAQILPVNRPKVIVVHHSDWSSEWSNSTILNQLDLIDQVVCVNADTAQQLRNVIDKPVHFIPNAIDPKRIMPSGAHATLRAQHSIPEDAKLLLFGHRLSPEKRPDLAIEIAKLLPDNWFTVIAGDGAEQDKIKADAAATCDRVCVVGAVDSLADWFEVSDCFLSLSTFEGFGLSIGESMAAGLPTVSTATGIAPGLATTLPTDATAQQWADAIVTAKPLVTPEEILERFSVQRMVDSWANVIKKMPVP
jgi:glycosyltransferase involved in cell wall biosynthesis